VTYAREGQTITAQAVTARTVLISIGISVGSNDANRNSSVSDNDRYNLSILERVTTGRIIRPDGNLGSLREA